MSDAPDQPLDGKRVVVIGGTSGFGLATARVAAEQGAAVIIGSSRQTSIDRVLETLPDSVTGSAVDARNPEALERFFDGVGPFDHLVFTAGDALDPMTIDRTTIEAAKSFFELRFWGAFLSAKFGSTRLRPGGSIVFTAGLAGRRPSKGGSLGASSSTALEGLTRALAVELAPIRVNLVIAGVVDTPLWDGMPAEQRESFLTSIGQRLPVHRVGTAADVADANLYLMRQGYATGSFVVIDGGGALV